MGGISRDEWLAALGETVKPTNDAALTVSELSVMFGCGRQAAYLKLNALVRQGRATRVHKRVADCAGRLRLQPAYLLKPDPPCPSKKSGRK
jgi:hypothetical protein